jgi:hypothetical protein
MKEVHDFFRLIYSCADPEWFLEIRKLEPRPVSWHIDRVKNLGSWVNQGLEMAQNSSSLHFRVAPSFSENRKDLAMATTLWADVERTISEEEKEALQDLEIPPSAVVHSGRGVHMYWTLKEPIDLDAAKAKNEALALLLQGDEGAGHPSHTLRFPGSYNCKYIPKKLVTVQVFGERYDISRFDFLKAPKPKIKKTEPPKTARTVGFDRIKKAAFRCPVLDVAIHSPEKLSYYAWCSIACLTDEKSFVKISSLDRERFNEKEATETYRYLKDSKYRPWGCNRIPEAGNCPRLGRCGLRKVVYEQDT